MEDIQEELESDRRREEPRDSERLHVSSPQVESPPDPERSMPQTASIMSPRSTHIIDEHSHPVEEADYRIAHSSFGLHDLDGLRFQQACISDVRSLQRVHDEHHEPSSRVGGSAMNQIYSSPLSSTFMREDERRRSYNFSLPPINSIGNEDVSSSSAARLYPAIHARNSVLKHSPNGPRELIKYFIDKVAPWV